MKETSLTHWDTNFQSKVFHKRKDHQAYPVLKELYWDQLQGPMNLGLDSNIGWF